MSLVVKIQETKTFDVELDDVLEFVGEFHTDDTNTYHAVKFLLQFYRDHQHICSNGYCEMKEDYFGTTF